MKIRYQIIFTSLISIVLLIIVAGLTFVSLTSLLTNSGWVVHTYQVIEKANGLTTSMVNQETGMRGYLVTGNEDYLEPYTAGVEEFQSIISELKGTVSDNPVQVGKLSEVEDIANRWTSEAAEEFIAIKDEIIQGDVIRKNISDMVKQGVGKEKMDVLREALENTSGNERTKEKILLAMLNMETGLRGFIVTNDEEFLEPYTNNKQILNRELKALNNSNITSLAMDWVANVGEHIVSLQRRANTYRTNDDLYRLMQTHVGKKNMDAIRVKIDEFIQAESSLLTTRTLANEKTSDMTKMILIIGIMLSIIISVPMALMIAGRINKQLGGEPKEVADITEEIAEGNLNVSFESTRKKTGIYNSIFNMQQKLNEVITNINLASEQVSSGSKQVSDSSMSLSQGATEQASSIEELTASIEEIAAQTRQNASNAEQAREVTILAQKYATQGNKQMADMLKAMAEINDSSNNIFKIIKVIDDIAFQTNILALNAAVEAARAGKHGKGFAVVAEEVRNLAARSASAAKETTAMIEGSIVKVEGGTKIANETAEALSKIVDGVLQATEFVSEIATASSEQAIGVDQVSQGIMQISDVVQTTSATAEETAAASEELSSQAEMLKSQVDTFNLRKNRILKGYGQEAVESEVL